MKRWTWLWVLPWTVVVSSQPYAAHCELDFMSKHSFSQVMVLLDKEACFDFAEALNEAHERRMHQLKSDMFGVGHKAPVVPAVCEGSGISSRLCTEALMDRR